MSIPHHHQFSNDILCDFPSSGIFFCRPGSDISYLKEVIYFLFSKRSMHHYDIRGVYGSLTTTIQLFGNE